MNGKIILDLCCGTAAWSEPYAQAGYDIRKVDIIHEQDVRFLLFDDIKGVHGILAAPPCTVFASSGARWPRTERQMIDGLSIVDACLRAVLIGNPKWWALENPVGKLTRYLGPPAMYFDPCDYGDSWTKRTALWGNFNIPKKRPVKPQGKNPIWHMPPSPDRPKLRSITPPGFARAFFEANP